MDRCPKCQGARTPAAKFCAHCGADFTRLEESAPSLLETEVSPLPSDPPHPSVASSPTSGNSSGALFVAGQVLMGRYRIIGVLGKGGMGEVYRAEDLMLGIEVALKFLAPSLASDARVRERFYGEVRAARQISHPNVCRVHDIGEMDGQPYLSMEYVDGEDLDSLLTRIGRLPKDKAIDIARQLCAGLAAAHSAGLIHRDLKPANVMIDGKGKVRITDFGLAGIATSVTDIRSGTPAYMAPEQLNGEEVSLRSDLYSIGLVLYEVFTGKPAFRANSVAELKTLHEGKGPSNPSTLIEDMDSSVEAVILRCMESRPEDRPDSALAIAAALPGGDPLMAALAAGEVPSAELVAASGAKGTIPLKRSAILFSVSLLAVLVWLLFGKSMQVQPNLKLPYPPSVLETKAQEILDELLPNRAVVDRGGAFGRSSAFNRWAEQQRQAGGGWETYLNERPSAVFYWYRESPRPFQIEQNEASVLGPSDPDLEISGQTRISLLPDGRMDLLYHVPPQNEVEPDASLEPDWGLLFEKAGLNIDTFNPVEPEWNPAFYATVKRAWEGTIEELPNETIRIEAAGYGNLPITFEMMGPWTLASRDVPKQERAPTRARDFVNVLLLLLILTMATWYARKNLMSGRSDRRGAFRLALFAFIAQLTPWILIGHHQANIGALWNNFVRIAGLAFFIAFLTWLVYIALEPQIRRRFPDRIVAWTRLLSGRYKDPLVHRDILIGITVGSVLSLIWLASIGLGRYLERPSVEPLSVSTAPLSGFSWALSWLAGTAKNEVFSALLTYYGWFLTRVGFKNRWVANGLFAALVLFMTAAGDFDWATLPLIAILAIAVVTVMERVGLLATTLMMLSLEILTGTMVPNMSGAWWSAASWIPYLVLTLLLIYAFRKATEWGHSEVKA